MEVATAALTVVIAHQKHCSVSSSWSVVRARWTCMIRLLWQKHV